VVSIQRSRDIDNSDEKHEEKDRREGELDQIAAALLTDESLQGRETRGLHQFPPERRVAELERAMEAGIPGQWKRGT
jgi:hypothetical protein